MSKIERWRQTEIQRLLALEGRRIQRLVGVEMAILESGIDSRPQFSHPKVPFLQICPLYLYFSNSDLLKLITYQNDAAWGLCLSVVDEEEKSGIGKDERSSIFRTRELHELPSGQIQSATVERDGSNEISELSLQISGRNLLLIAGEVYETCDSTEVDIVKGDESILIFSQPEKANKISWKGGP